MKQFEGLLLYESYNVTAGLRLRRPGRGALVVLFLPADDVQAPPQRLPDGGRGRVARVCLHQTKWRAVATLI